MSAKLASVPEQCRRRPKALEAAPEPCYFGCIEPLGCWQFMPYFRCVVPHFLLWIS